MKKISKSEEEWKKQLTPLQYRILRHKGTEPPFANEFNSFHEEGTFHCAACGTPLFSSKAKFDSETGWPSFYEPVSKDAVEEHTDSSFGIERIEMSCAVCGGHLGHIFPDGPEPTGMRYCSNSAILKFEPAKKSKANAKK